MGSGGVVVRRSCSAKAVLPLLLLLCVFLFSSASEGATIYVKEGATGSGGSWENATGNLKAALDGATGGDVLWVAKGTYKPHATDREASFVLKSGVELYGGFNGTESGLEQRDPAAYPTILTGNIGDPGNHDDNSYHVVYSSGVDSTAVLDGFTITGGRANDNGDQYGKGSGGGMYATGGSPTVRNCIFTANFALYYGGGMYNTESSPAVTNCTFSENRANHGGGMHNYVESSPTVTNCTFTGNSADIDGGGMQNHSNSDPTVTNCTFTGNSADYGGGGGMKNSTSDPTVINCTFTGNSAEYGGGGGMNNYWSGPTVTNCIFWASSGGEIVNSGTSAPSFFFCVVQGGYEGGTEILTGDPKLGPLADNGGPTRTHALLAGSSALDTGKSADAPATDQRGVSRPRGAGHDIGAYERLSEPVYVNAAATGENNGASWTDAYADLRTALLFGGGEIWVAAGSYAPTEDTDRTKSFVLKNGVELYGGFNGTESGREQRDPAVNRTILTGDIGGDDVKDADGVTTAINGDNSYHVVYAENVTNAVLDGFTITGGSANAGDDDSSNPQNFGGGMYATGGSPAVTGCIFSGNGAYAFGGGMYAKGGSPAVTSCTFSGNSADSGGGMFNDASGGLVVTDSFFLQNAAGNNGGGILA